MYVAKYFQTLNASLGKKKEEEKQAKENFRQKCIVLLHGLICLRLYWVIQLAIKRTCLSLPL